MAQQRKEIEIIIKADGTVDIDQQGYEGKGCAGDVEDIIKALGKETKKTKKQEYFKQNNVKINIKK